MVSLLPISLFLAVVAMCSLRTSGFVAGPAISSSAGLARKEALVGGLVSRRASTSCAPASTATRTASSVMMMASAAYAPSSIQEAWDNHFSAFGGRNLEKILLDYDENSVITTYNQTSGDKQVYKGVEGARSLFTGLFEALSDLSDLAAPVVDVSEDSRMVFLVWRCPASGIADATDTFVFDDRNKIYRQNVAFRTG